MCEWVSVNDRLPPKAGVVLVWVRYDYGRRKRKRNEFCMFADYTKRRGFYTVVMDGDAYSEEVTHWMPLPAGPSTINQQG